MPADQPDLAWFEYRSERGVDHEGNLQPIVQFGLSVAMPQLVGANDVLPTASASCIVRQHPELSDEVAIRIIPGTRIVETRELALASAVLASGLFDQIERPTQAKINAAKGETTACVEAHERRFAAIATGDQEHPAARDIIPPGDPAPSGAVSIPGTIEHRFTAEDRLAIDNAIEAGTLVSDEVFADYIAKSTVADLLNDIGDDRLFALRALIAEEARDEPRKGLIAKLSPIAEQED